MGKFINHPSLVMLILNFQDELRQQKEEEMDDYCSQVGIYHGTDLFLLTKLVHSLLPFLIAIYLCSCLRELKSDFGACFHGGWLLDLSFHPWWVAPMNLQNFEPRYIDLDTPSLILIYWFIQFRKSNKRMIIYSYPRVHSLGFFKRYHWNLSHFNK